MGESGYVGVSQSLSAIQFPGESGDNRFGGLDEAAAWASGQYVRIRLHLRDDPDALVVPQAALGSSQLGKFLYVVGKDNVVEQRIVSLGATHDGMVAIRTGAAEGDQVIDGNL